MQGVRGEFVVFGHKYKANLTRTRIVKIDNITSDGQPVAPHVGTVLGDTYQHTLQAAEIIARRDRNASVLMLAAAIRNLVDKCGLAPGYYRDDERRLRRYAALSVQGWGIDADYFALVGHVFVADVPMDDDRRIQYRTMVQHEIEEERAA